MKYLLLIISTFAAYSQESTTLKLDEFYFKSLRSAVQNDSKVMLVYIENLLPELAVFDFLSETIYRVNDGRISPTTSVVLASGEGFLALFTHHTAMKSFRLTGKGEFLSSQRADDWHGWETDFLLTNFTPAVPDKAYAVFRSQTINKGEVEAFYSELDFNKKQVKVILNTKHDADIHQTWLYRGDKLYRCWHQTGLIERLNPTDFSVINIIHPEREPVKKNPKPRRPNRSQYKAVWGVTYSFPPNLYFNGLERRDKSGVILKEARPQVLAITDKGILRDVPIIVAGYQNKKLIYDWQEERMVLKRIE